MLRRGLALALAALTMTGCFGDGGSPAHPAAASDADASNVSRDALPQGREGSFAAFNETNATERGAGGLDHRHDLWNGKERDTILQGEFGMVYRFPPGNGALARIRLPAEKLVWEGTGSVEITLSNPERRGCSNLYTSEDEGGTWNRVCTDHKTGARLPDPAGGPKVRLWYRDAVAADWIDAGDVAWGKTTAIPIQDPKQTDMPHSTSTLWEFQVRSADTQDDTLVFDAKVDVVRAPGEIPLWPGHPDFYADGHARLVHQDKGRTREDGTAAILSQSATPLEYNHPDKLVSYGTRTLYVFANVTSVSAPDAASKPSGWFLEFHNASGVVNGTALDGLNDTHAWVLRVGDQGMDSPYATQSRWGFLLRAAFFVGHEDVTGVTCTGCTQYEVEYDLTVIATDEELPPEAYAAEA